MWGQGSSFPRYRLFLFLFYLDTAESEKRKTLSLTLGFFTLFVIHFQAFLIQNVRSLHGYKGHADNYICSLIPGAPFSQAQYTPGFLIAPFAYSLLSLCRVVVSMVVLH